MPKSGEFASPTARAVFAKERRGEVSRGAAARLPTALTLGARPEPSHKASAGSKASGNSGGTTASSILPRVKPMRDLNAGAGAGAGRVSSAQRQAERLASRLRGRSATQQSVRRVRPERTLGVGRTASSRNPASRS